MLSASDRKSLIITLSVFLTIISVTTFIVFLAQGYQINFNSKKESIIQVTGLLSVTSQPKGASVFINDRLSTATDDTLNLSPGSYLVKILKDGYLPWQKNISIKKEVVFQTDANLLRSVPELSPITLSGTINPAVSLDNTKIVYSVASASATKDNGLYLVEFTNLLLPLTRNSPRQLAPNYPNTDWSKAQFTFSPDSRQVLAYFPHTGINYLLNLNASIVPANLIDITSKLTSLQKEWQIQSQNLIESRLEKLPSEIAAIISTESSRNITLNTSEDKVLYLSQASASLPEHLLPSPPAQSTQNQNRDITPANWYVYDLKDDTNFLIGSSSDIENPSWLPNSNDIVYLQGNSINAVEYDATNRITLFAGSFNRSVILSTLDGTRLVTLTSPYTGSPDNLYSISIR